MRAILLGGIMGAAATVVAQEAWKLPGGETRFRPGAGAEVAAANCVLCHSADYISTQPPLERTVWLATVTKMREKYGAPLPTNQVERVVDYLARTYGKKPQPASATK